MHTFAIREIHEIRANKTRKEETPLQQKNNPSNVILRLSLSFEHYDLRTSDKNNSDRASIPLQDSIEVYLLPHQAEQIVNALSDHT